MERKQPLGAAPAAVPGAAPVAVSVLMCVWAGDDPGHLVDALDSVAAQTLHDWECLVVVDGPIGPDLEAVLAQRSGDPRFRIVRQAVNQGPAATRNLGVRLAAGRAVAILDADDAAEPDRLRVQLQRLDAGADVTASWLQLIDGAGAPIGARPKPLGHDEIVDALWQVNPVNHSSAMIRTQLLLAVPYREGLRFGEDYRLWVDLAARGARFDCVPQPLVRYRVLPSAGKHGGARHRGLSVVATQVRSLRLYPTGTALRRAGRIAPNTLAAVRRTRATAA